MTHVWLFPAFDAAMRRRSVCRESMLGIQHNGGSLAVHRNLSQVSRRQLSSARNLASGEAVHTAADNAAGIAVKTTFTASLRGKRQAYRNVQEASSMMQVVEGSVAKLSDLFVRGRELAVQAANDTLGKSQRLYLDKEFQDVIDEVERVFETTEYNGQLLLDNGAGTFDPAGLTFQVGSEASSQDRIDIDLNFKSIKKEFDLVKLGGNLNLVKLNAPRLNINVFDRQLEFLHVQRTQIGSTSNRLQATAEQLGQAIENEADSLSRIADTDMGEESTALAQERVLMDAGTSILAQANANHGAMLGLLR